MRREGEHYTETLWKRKWGSGLVQHAISAILAEMTENKTRFEQCDPVQDEMKRMHEILETMLAMADAFCSLQQEIKTGALDNRLLQEMSSREDQEQEDVARLSRHLIDCQYFSVVRLEHDPAIMHPLLVLGPSAEYKAQWHQRLEGESLESFLADEALLEHLSSGNMVSLDLPMPLEALTTGRCLMIPVLAELRLEGLLLLLPSPQGEIEKEEWHPYLVQVVTRVATLIITCQKAIYERDQALAMLKDAHAELERLNAIKSDFVALMNNDFRSSLLAIQEASEAIRDKDLGLADVREFAVDIYADAQHLLHMISSQLELSCLTTGPRRLQQGWLNMNAIIADVVNRLRQSAHHLIRLQLARALPILIGDHEKLTYVISHLLKNAVHYSPDGGEICVSSMVEGQIVHICIRDQGVGIPAFELEKIFTHHLSPDGGEPLQPFRGLSTVREIVQMHGGEIWVESSLGAGSAFHFTIPYTAHNQSI